MTSLLVYLIVLTLILCHILALPAYAYFFYLMVRRLSPPPPQSDIINGTTLESYISNLKGGGGNGFRKCFGNLHAIAKLHEFDHIMT